ncbi:MAG: AMP-binding protein, partial [Terriglobales bacterium]
MNIGTIASRNAWRYPNKVGLVDANNGQRMTWAEFNSAVNRLAHALLARGLKKGDAIAIYSRNSLEYMQLFMAGAKTGIVIQPMNWRFNADEIAYTLKDGAPRGILVSAEYATLFRTIQHQLSSIEFVAGIGAGHAFDLDFHTWIAPCSTNEPDTVTHVGDGDLYFVCYTGGTTGIAKGVMITHRNALTTCMNMTVAETISTDDVYLVMGQMFHIAVLLPHGYMFHGARVIILNFEARKTLEVIQAERVTSFLAISTMMNYLLDVPDFASFDLKCVRLLSYGGGPFATATLRRAAHAFPGVGFLQYMGQTEVSIMSAWLGPEDHRLGMTTNPRLLSSCGREALLCDCRVVDENDHEVPRDGKTPGEML